MIDISARSVVSQFAKHILGQHVWTSFSEGKCVTRGVVFNFDVHMRVPGSHDHDHQAREGIHVLVAGNHYAFGAHGSLMWSHETKWTNLGNHNSCWIDSVDTFLNERYFALCEAADPNKAPKEMSQQSWFSAFRPLTLVEVALEADRDNPKLSDAKKVTSIKILDKSEFDKLTQTYSFIRS